ncbi:MAG: hypothetical protein AMXMBFR23_18240 [Chloroflexota bacterium]
MRGTHFCPTSASVARTGQYWPSGVRVIFASIAWRLPASTYRNGGGPATRRKRHGRAIAGAAVPRVSGRD